jgi:hypothetical protein
LCPRGDHPAGDAAVADRAARQGGCPSRRSGTSAGRPIFEAACLPGEDDEPPLQAYNPLKGEIVEDQRVRAVNVERGTVSIMQVLRREYFRWCRRRRASEVDLKWCAFGPLLLLVPLRVTVGK